MLNNKDILTIKKGKLSCCLFLILLCFFAFIVYANTVRDLTFRISAPFVNTESKNLVFYKNKVFGTKNSFNKNLAAYIEEEKNFLKNKDEFIVVKIKGEYSVLHKADYILINEESVPDLNAELYIAKNFDFADNSVPLKTVVALMQRILNIVVCILFSITFSVCFFNIAEYLIIKKTNYLVVSIKTFRNG